MTRIRTFLICLLVLALPAQAVRAATMLFCGPGHGAGQTIGTAAAVPVEHAHHAHHAQAQQEQQERHQRHHPHHPRHMAAGGAPAPHVQGPGQQVTEATAAAHAASSKPADDTNAAAAAPAMADAAAPTNPSHGDAHTCSACASCCSAAAFPSLALVLPEPPPAAVVFATLVPTIAAFAASGPDRPPRLLNLA